MAKTKTGVRNKKASVKSSSRAIKKKLTLRQVLSILGKEEPNKHRYYMKISNDKKTGTIQFDAVDGKDLFYLGTHDLELIINTVVQIGSICSPDKPLSEIGTMPVNAALASIIEIDPQDSTELMLASQMVAVHNMAMEMSRRAMNVEQTDKVVKKLRALCDKAGREWDLEISVTPGARLTPELRDQYASIGVDRLIPMIPQNSEAQLLEYVDALASEMGI